MSINPQFTYDKTGHPVGVFLPIEEWNQVSEALHLEIPDWQKKLLDNRLAQYHKNTDDTLDWDEIALKMKQEDETV